MAWARTAEQLKAQRALMPKRREKNGQAQRATTVRAREAPVVDIALAQPHRKGKDDPLAGFVIGRMFLKQTIDKNQFNAGQKFTEVCTRYMRDVLDTPIRYGFGGLDGAGGKSCAAEIDDETIADLREQWAGIRFALAETGRDRVLKEALIFACVLDEEPKGPEAIADLHNGLHALARLWA